MDSTTLTIPGFTIGYKTWGNPALPPMLALHGWLDNANSFDLLAPYLEKQFYFIAIDFPGHGYSSHLSEGCYYHFSDGIFNILQVIKALGLGQIHLLGHSMGACLASLIAGVVPEQILSMALIEGLGPFSNPDFSCRDQLSRYSQLISKEANKSAKPYQSLEQAALARAKRGYLSKELAAILAQRGLEEKEEQFYWRHDRRLLLTSPLTMTEGQVLSCLKGIRAKSCLIWASQGFGFDSNIMSERVKTVNDLQIYHLEGGHHIHMEQPGAVAQCLAQFYQD
ncbi:alpha/beta fold hydrolase [Legionella massiliensis]|nr:alpha/beta hydrolase [Legionella massiliensis]